MALTALSSPQPDVTQPPSKPRDKKPKRLNSALKKVGQYFKDQALANSQNSSTLYLSPPDSRWIQRGEYTHELHSNDEINAQLSRKITALNQHASYLPSNYYLNKPSPLSSRTTSYSMTSAATSVGGPGIFQNMTRHQYASDNIMQSYDILIPERAASDSTSPDAANEEQYWIVYVHGGYFRDPKVDSTSFKPTISILESIPASSDRVKISGYCSINYRLSSHPGHPQSPSTPAYTLNNARWPAQPSDILRALSHLQSHHSAAKKYILVGHSVGATLSFLAALQTADKKSNISVAPPAAVVGVSGIYDFPAIHESNPEYEDMTKNAMEAKYYEEASPACYDVATYTKKWTVKDGERVVVLAHSRDDGLVGWDQIEEMQKVFEGQPGFNTKLVELKGIHNGIWEKGAELARAITETLEMMS